MDDGMVLGHENMGIVAEFSDIFPTGYHGTGLAGVSPDNAVAARSALLRGAAQVFVIDKETDRLTLVAKIATSSCTLTAAAAPDS
jgi:glutathione-independent formaldehyde dehydrogenase